jgi:hypothetical protein
MTKKSHTRLRLLTRTAFGESGTPHRMIDLPRGPMRDYLRAFGLHAIYLTADGRAHAAAIPKGDIIAIAWTTQSGARRIAKRVNDVRDNTSEKLYTIEAAAAALRVGLTQHDDAMARARSTVAKVNTALAHAKARGDLAIFHRAFAEYRRQAAEQGIRAQSYGRAYTRLRATLFVHAARGEALPPIADLVRSTLGAS